MTFLEPNTKELVRRAMQQTLEGMAFAEAVPREDYDDDMPIHDEVAVWTCIEVLEPMRGWLRIECTRPLARDLTLAMYGLFDEDELKPTMVKDAIGEMANTFAGRFCAERFPSGEAFKVGLPEYGEKIKRKEASKDWPVQEMVVDGQRMRLLVDPDLNKAG